MEKINLLLIIVMLGIQLSLCAQENHLYESNLPAYIEYVGKEYGISVKAPEGFKDLDKYNVMWTARKEPALGVGNVYGPIFLSNKKDCMIMYGAYPRSMNGNGGDRPG